MVWRMFTSFKRNISCYTIICSTLSDDFFCNIRYILWAMPLLYSFLCYNLRTMSKQCCPFHHRNASSWITDFFVWKLFLYFILQQRAFGETSDKQYDINLFHIFLLKQNLQVPYNMFLQCVFYLLDTWSFCLNLALLTHYLLLFCGFCVHFWNIFKRLYTLVKVIIFLSSFGLLIPMLCFFISKLCKSWSQSDGNFLLYLVSTFLPKTSSRSFR